MEPIASKEALEWLLLIILALCIIGGIIDYYHGFKDDFDEEE